MTYARIGLKKIATRIFTCSRHVIDVLVCLDWFIKIAKPVQTGHVWTGKLSFVRVPDTVTAFKGDYVFHINRPL